MKCIKILLISMVVSSIFLCGCKKEIQELHSVYQNLVLSFHLEKYGTRALINSLSNGEMVGVSVVDDSGAGYNGNSYLNVKATASFSSETLVWELDSEVKLNDTFATIYAYYPYNSSVTDFKAIPVETVTQTDYMYGTPVTGVSASSSNADIMLNHALTAIRVKLQRGTYKGKGAVNSISLQGTNIGLTGVLDATNGTLTGVSGVGDALMVDCGNGTTIDGGISDIIFVPVVGKEGELAVTLTVDGTAYSCTVDACSFVQGSVYTCTLTMDTSGLSLAGMSFGDWGYTASGYPVISVGGKKVTFSGNIENIAFNNKVNDDGSVTITAVPLEEGRVVEEVRLNGVEPVYYTQSLDDATGIRTVTLSNVSADQTIVFNGAWYPVYVTGDDEFLSYTLNRNSSDGSVVLTASPRDDGDRVNEFSGSGDATMTQTFNSGTGGRVMTVRQQTGPYTICLAGVDSDWLIVTYDIATAGTHEILDMYFEGISHMNINGVIMDADYEYQFDTAGTYKIKFKLNSSALDDGLFYNNNRVKEVIVPDKVTSIGNNVFYRCSEVTKIKLSPNITSIGNDAFFECKKLTDGIILTDNLKELGISAFEGCSSLTDISIPSSLTILNEGCFKNCTSLKEISIPNSIRNIGAEAFYYCNNADNDINIPSTVLSIGKSAFYGCEKLKGHLIIPSTIKEISEGAFAYCSSLENVSIPSSVTTINIRAFKECKSLTSVVIPNSVISIGDSAFEDCLGMTELVLSTKLNSIGVYAFENCPGLVGTLTIPNSVTTIGKSAFYGCDGLTEVIIGNGVSTIGDYAFSSMDGLKRITIGPNVKSIGQGGLYYNKNLQMIISHAAVAPSLGRSQFSYVKRKGVLVIPIGSSGYDKWMSEKSGYLGDIQWKYREDTEAENGVYYSSDGKTAMMVDNGYQGEINIKEGVATVANNAMLDCSFVTSVTLPQSVKTIGKYSFAYCSKIIDIVIPNSVTSIGERAFEYSSNLTSITIGSSVKTIGDWCFFNTNLKKITSLPYTQPTIGSNTFYSIGSGGVLIVPSGANYSTWLGTKENYLREDGTGFSRVDYNDYVLENGIYYSSDGKTLFGNDGTLTGDVIIKDGVTSIADYAFHYCRTIRTITLPSTVKTIGDKFIMYCSSLNKIRCLATTAPSISTNSFKCYWSTNAELVVPTGATGYDAWKKSGSYYVNWTIVYE